MLHVELIGVPLQASTSSTSVRVAPIQSRNHVSTTNLRMNAHAHETTVLCDGGQRTDGGIGLGALVSHHCESAFLVPHTAALRRAIP